MAPVALIEHSDLITSAIAFGFTTGFGILTAWEVVKQTMRARAPLRSMYIWLCWVELMICFVSSLILLFMLGGAIPFGLPLIIILMIMWAMKIHVAIQIICNRVALILPDRDQARWLKWGMFVLCMILVVMGFATWVPAQLQVESFPRVNYIVERLVKSLYVVIDSGLNFLFVRIVRKRLVEVGLNKYDKIVRFNIRIIFISIGMDLLIIGTMSMKNPLVYTQFHPLGFMVKLRIELAMAELIRKIATQQSDMLSSSNDISLSLQRHPPTIGSNGRYNNNSDPLATITSISCSPGKRDVERGEERGDIVVETQVRVETDGDSRSGTGESELGGGERGRGRGREEEDVEPLNESWRRQGGLL